MHIRLFEAQDKETYMQLATQMYSSKACIHDPNPQAFAGNFLAAVDKHNPYFTGVILEENGCGVGYCLIAQSWSSEFGKRMNFIEEIYLEEASRGKGWLRLLFAWIFEHYQQEECVFRLEVSPENKEVMAMYEKYGFEPLDYLQMVRTKH